MQYTQNPPELQKKWFIMWEEPVFLLKLCSRAGSDELKNSVNAPAEDHKAGH
jgi:hypothetical protein